MRQNPGKATATTTKTMGFGRAARAALVLLAVGALAVGCGTDKKADPGASTDGSAKAAGSTAQKGGGDAAKAGAQGGTKPAGAEVVGEAGGFKPTKGLVLALARFEKKDGKSRPAPARAEILTVKDGKWVRETLDDPDSNVFHKAMPYTPPGGKPGLLTVAGMKAKVTLWNREGGAFKPNVLWTKDFGGKFSRMRDVEIAPLYGDGKDALAVATHDQGIVAALKVNGGKAEVQQLDATKDTFVHEIEIGDINKDGKLEVYSTPSEPNRFDGKAQSGRVMRYVPADPSAKPTIVADLGDRHAKEILVTDIDGDGTDELYVAVEAKTKKEDGKTKLVEPVEIRRYDADTDPKKGVVIATLQDRLCRFLTAGDVDGDGKRELVAAPFRSGIWLMRPGADPKAAWTTTQIAKDSSGFEHAALLTDLDGDKKDELYVASDDQGEFRQYTWNGSGFDAKVIFSRPDKRSVLTWNIMPIPMDALK